MFFYCCVTVRSTDFDAHKVRYSTQNKTTEHASRKNSVKTQKRWFLFTVTTNYFTNFFGDKVRYLEDKMGSYLVVLTTDYTLYSV